jgi:hypothetical protein
MSDSEEEWRRARADHEFVDSSRGAWTSICDAFRPMDASRNVWREIAAIQKDRTASLHKAALTGCNKNSVDSAGELQYWFKKQCR